MSYRNDRGRGRGHRGHRGGYNEYGGRGGGYHQRGGYRHRGSYNSYMPQNNSGGMGGPSQMPGGPGMVIPPEMLAQLQKKLQEKFPGASIPFAQDNMMQNMPLHLPVSNMRFKPPTPLVPDSSGFYGDLAKFRNKQYDEAKDQDEKEQTNAPPEELFNDKKEEEKFISEYEKDHLEEIEKMSNQEYLNQKIKEKTEIMKQKLKESVNVMKEKQASAEQIKSIYKTIFTRMKESLQTMKGQMMQNIHKRIEENIAKVRVEIYHTLDVCEQFEEQYLQGNDLTQLEPAERKDKVEIPISFKIQDLVDMKDREKIQTNLESLDPNPRMEKQKNITICNTFFRDVRSSIRHRFNDISKFEELDFLTKKDIDEVVEKVMDEFVPIHLFSETTNTLKEGSNPALYSFEWNSNLVNIYQIKERKSECRVVKFPNGFPMFSRIAITYDGRVFLTGGFFKELSLFLRTTYEYIEKENKMKRRANMSLRRSDHSVVYNKGYIYAVGAFIDGKFSNSVERYDIKNNLWEELDSMHIPRSGVGLCVFNSNFIFAFGGRNSNNYHMTAIESYDIKQDIWRNIDYAQTDIWDEGAYLCQAHQISKDKIIIFGKSAPPTEELVKS